MNRMTGVFAFVAVALAPAVAAVQTTPFAPPPIVQGGQVVVLFPPGSPFLKMDRIAEPEQNNMTRGVPGRIQSIVNIHNPSIEFHPADPGTNTGTVVILARRRRAQHAERRVGRGGLRAVLLQLRRQHGHPAQPAAARWLRPAHRRGLRRAAGDPARARATRRSGISIRTRSASSASRQAPSWPRRRPSRSRRSTRGTARADDPLAGVSSRPDFVGLDLSGPDAVRARREHGDPKRTLRRRSSRAPAPTMRCTRCGRIEYFGAMLKARVPNVEMHIYGNGVHGNGLKDRNGTPFGTWQDRFIDWFRDLGFLGKPGVETKAAKDVAAHVAAPERGGRGGRGGN